MSEEEKQNQPISENRKAAFLRYMAILFAVAFVMVLSSMILQSKTSKATISELNEASRSALQNAMKLQEENRALQEERDELDRQVAALTEQLSEGEAVREELEQTISQQEAQEKEAAAERELTLNHTVEAYEALLVAMQCETQEGNVTFSRAVDTVERFMDCLGPRAQAAYEVLTEVDEETEADADNDTEIIEE